MFGINKLSNPKMDTHSFALGVPNVSIEKVENAIDALIRRMSPALLRLVTETEEKRKQSLIYGHCIEKQWNCDDETLLLQERYSRCEHAEIQIHSLEEGENNEYLIENAEFFLRLDIKTEDLNKEDDLEYFLLELKSSLSNLGYCENGLFDIHFEKGCLRKKNLSNSWHFDGFKTSITICYSTKENWSTQIVDPHKDPLPIPYEQLKEELSSSELQELQHDPKALSQMNSQMDLYGEPSQLGVFYDAVNILHRAPNQLDLKDRKLSTKDFRLFIRYREFEGES